MKAKFFVLLLFAAIAGQVLAEGFSRKANFPSSSRNGGIGFSIGKKGYFGMGQKQVKLYVYKVYNDFWEYDSEKNIWTQKSDYPGGGRINAKAFAHNGKGYVGFGYLIILEGPDVGLNNFQTDLYEFEPAENKWTKKTGNMIGERDVCFVLNDSIYSVNPEYRSLKKYDPSTDSWTERKWEKKEMMPYYMTVAGNGSSFVIGKTMYMVTTVRKKGDYVNQLWEFEPNECAWLRDNDLPGPGSDVFSVFSVGEKRFIMRRDRDFLEYNKATDAWVAKAADVLPDKYLYHLFTIDGKGYGLSKFEFWELVP